MKEFIRHHTTRKVRTRDLLEILPRRGPEVFHAFCCTLLSLKRDDLVKVLTNPDTEDMDMFPGTVAEGAYQPRHRRHGDVFPGTVEFSFGRKPIPDCRTRRNPAD